MTVAAVVLALWLVFKGNSKDLGVLLSKPGNLLIGSLALAFNYAGFMQGVHYTSPANAQIFIQLGPLLLAVAGLVIFKERLSQFQKLGFVFCFIGFGLFFWDRMSMVNSNSTSDFYIGFAWIVAGAITWALFATLQKKLLNLWSSSQINVYIYTGASLVYLPFVNWQSLIELPISIHLFYIFLGLNTIVAYGCLSVALKNLPATQVSPIITMNPLFTLVLINIIAWMEWTFIPPDPISMKGYIGAVVAIAGIIFVITKRRQTKV